MPAQYPSLNDREFDLDKKIANNTALIAGGGVVLSIAGTPGQIATSGSAGAVTLSLPADVDIANSLLVGVVGTSIPNVGLDVVSTSTSSPRGISTSQYTTDTLGARLGFRKARGTRDVPLAVVTGDNLGRLNAWAYDGTSYIEDSSIIFGVEGTTGTNRSPSNISFWTSTNAAPSVLTQRLIIDSAGNFTAAAGAWLINNATGGMPAPGVINAKGFQIDGTPLGTSTDSYWSVVTGGILYGSNITVGGIVNASAVTSAAATNLTLTGNGGASLVLGQGASGIVTLAPAGAGVAITGAKYFGVLGSATASGGSFTVKAGFGTNGGNVGGTLNLLAGRGNSGAVNGNVVFGRSDSVDDAVVDVEFARIVGFTGNLLLGTTSDMANTVGGLYLNSSGTGSTASSTTTGSLRVHNATGDVGIGGGAIYASGAGSFGGNLTRSGSSDVALITTTSGADSVSEIQYINTGASGTSWRAGVAGNIYGTTSVRNKFYWYSSSYLASLDTNGLLSLLNTAGGLSIAATTASTSTTTGSLTTAGGLGVAGNANIGGVIGVGASSLANIGLLVAHVSTLTGVGQVGIDVEPTFSSAATTSGAAGYFAGATAAASYTITALYGVRIGNATKGAASTITNQYGLRIEDQTRGGANYAISTGTGLVAFGDSTEASTGGAGSLTLAGGLYAAKKIVTSTDLIVGKTSVTTPSALAYASPTSVDVTLANVFTTTTVNATGSVTFNATAGGTAGQRVVFIITNDATSAKTITFGTNFTSMGTLTASGVNKKTTIEFISDGTALIELCRSVLP